MGNASLQLGRRRYPIPWQGNTHLVRWSGCGFGFGTALEEINAAALRDWERWIAKTSTSELEVGARSRALPSWYAPGQRTALRSTNKE